MLQANNLNWITKSKWDLDLIGQDYTQSTRARLSASEQHAAPPMIYITQTLSAEACAKLNTKVKVDGKPARNGSFFQ